MDDIEKNRSDYVFRLEEQVAHLRRQLNEIKPLADKWTPVISGEISVVDDEVRVTMGFGGKRTTATVAASVFLSHSPADMTVSITETLCSSLAIDKLREVVRPEVERLMRGAAALPGAGKW